LPLPPLPRRRSEFLKEKELVFLMILPLARRSMIYI